MTLTGNKIAKKKQIEVVGDLHKNSVVITLGCFIKCKNMEKCRFVFKFSDSTVILPSKCFKLWQMMMLLHPLYESVRFETMWHRNMEVIKIWRLNQRIHFLFTLQAHHAHTLCIDPIHINGLVFFTSLSGQVMHWTKLYSFKIKAYKGTKVYWRQCNGFTIKTASETQLCSYRLCKRISANHDFLGRYIWRQIT